MIRKLMKFVLHLGVLNISGSQTLKAVLFMYLFTITVFVSITITISIRGFPSEKCYKWMSYQTYIILRTILYSTTTFFLWLGARKRNRVLLGVHMGFAVVLSLMSIMLSVERLRCYWPFNSITDIIILTEGAKSLFKIIRVYGLYLVYKCYKQLGSSRMTILQDHFEADSWKNGVGIGFGDNLSLSHLEMRKQSRANVYTEPYNWNCATKKLDDYVISPLDIVIVKEDVILEGGFGKIVKGVLQKDGEKRKVAIKISENSQQKDTFQSLLEEVKMKIKVGTHENIVEFFGVSVNFSEHEDLAIITEYFDGAENLEKFLNSTRQSTISRLSQDFTVVCEDAMQYGDPIVYINLEEYGTSCPMFDLIRFAYEISSALEHLASKQIVLGALAARNILLTKAKKVKLANFGTFQSVYDKSGRLEINQWRWMAIESLENRIFSEASDVWSFGVVMWEIFSLGQMPYKNIPEWDEDVAELMRNEGLGRPLYASDQIYATMAKCWKTEPKERPTFSELKYDMWEILRNGCG